MQSVDSLNPVCVMPPWRGSVVSGLQGGNQPLIPPIPGRHRSQKALRGASDAF